MDSMDDSESGGEEARLASSVFVDAVGEFEFSGQEASAEADSEVTDAAVDDSESAVMSSLRMGHEGDLLDPMALETAHEAAEEDHSALHKEMAHLRQRIANTRTSFGSVAMTDPSNYQTNVLNAVQNCVREWRHIVKHYRSSSLTAADARRGGQWIFALVQGSLQTGPLAGAKPGYFKRCGSSFATLVHTYLCEICGGTPAQAIADLAWTEKQAAAVEGWKRKALQAAESEDKREASPYVQSKQKEALQKKQAKQKKKNDKKKQLGLTEVAGAEYF